MRVVTDEGHIITTNPLLARYVVKITKMWRKLGAWFWIATQNLDKEDPARVLPSRTTDRHALAVLIYMYLFFRHPLRGRKVFDPDPMRDEELGMGEQALFVEHPDDDSNRVRPDDLRPQALPWGDPAERPVA